MIERQELLTLVPHAGPMCLLERVVEWGPQTIVCTSSGHRRADHPLGRGGQLAAVHAFEYAAQAVAVHGGLLARSGGGVVTAGLLAALREGHLYVSRLDDLAGELRVEARRELAGAQGLIYQVTVSAERPVAEARVIIAARR